MQISSGWSQIQQIFFFHLELNLLQLSSVHLLIHSSEVTELFIFVNQMHTSLDIFIFQNSQ